MHAAEEGGREGRMTLIVLMTMLPPYVCAFHFPWLMVAFLP